VSKPWYSQNYILLLLSYHINFHSLFMSLIEYIYFHCIFYFYGPFLLNVLSMFLIYISLSIFLKLNHCFLVNLELITNSIAPLSNSNFTAISFYISIPSKPTYTVTSFRGFSQFGLPACIILLVSTVNLFEELS